MGVAVRKPIDRYKQDGDSQMHARQKKALFRDLRGIILALISPKLKIVGPDAVMPRSRDHWPKLMTKRTPQIPG